MTYTDSPQFSNDAFSVSIVTFYPDVALLEQTFSTLEVAFDRLRCVRPGLRIGIWLVDNGGLPDLLFAKKTFDRMDVAFYVISGQGNVGYARGHNLGIEQVKSCYHLVLNPDVELGPDSLGQALDFLDSHPEVGLLTPRIDDEAGRVQYLCRRYPTLLDLFIRGFLPFAFRRYFHRRLSHLEMHDVIGETSPIWDPPLVSGCFMLFRTETLKRLKGFDSRYFLYFEDYDLSLRTHEIARVAYVPAVRVIHHGGGASRKGFAHIRMFIASAFKFYNRFGWRLW
ncbi:glycosyltransferase family 2 protein [Burkholderia cenocepacia]|uniref:glycosyltransferase family 2 protein n=2 Tax=Burkholderia cenocepacia TaxID=95486 RepID=UPI0009B2C9A0|nr:glycosyltransferase family 2 protein [Burkholderia cenocepacia]MBO1855054.1 glycosyltransferase family 2 protein [Burkholderia cenocepacia]MDR5646100.1 glycosyltransferase family 2 protein [Burkholderia cenocepacia]